MNREAKILVPNRRSAIDPRSRRSVVRMRSRRSVLLAAAVALLSSACGTEGPGEGPEATPANTPHDMSEMEAEGGSDTMDGMAMDGMATDGTIGITPGEVQTFGITFGTAEVRELFRTVRSVGTVDFDETRLSYVAPKFGGWAERLHVDFSGRAVRAGEPLLDVYAPELVTAQEELLLAARMVSELEDSPVAAATSGASDLLASARRRLEYWEISAAQIDRLLETGEVQRTLTLHAPASGVVMEKNVVEGQAFQPGANLYLVAGLSEVWVNAEVFESDAAWVREGMPADVTVNALPGRTFSGRVEYLYPTLEDRTRSMRARIELANPDGALRPGMYATVRMTAAMSEALTVPASAVLHTGERGVVFVDMGGGQLMPHEVELGVRGDELVQVLSGLEPGARVVTSAQFLLDSESNLAEVMRAMMAQMGTSGGEMDMDGMEMDMPDAAGPDSVGGR